MENFLKITGGVVLGTFALFGLGLLSPLLGGISAWIVSLAFTSPFIFLQHITGLDFTPWQWGVALGFVGGFFRSTSQVKAK